MSSPRRHPLPPSLLLVTTVLVLLGQSRSTSQAPSRIPENLLSSVPASFAQTGLRSSRFLFSEPLTLPAQLPEEGRGVKRVRFVEVNLGLLAEPGATSLSADTAARLVELNLFPDVFLVALLERTESVAPGSFSWVGRINGLDLSHVILVVHNGILVGSIGTPSGSYDVRYIGGELYAIREVQPDQLPPEAPPIPVPHSGEPPAGPPWADSGDIFDLLVVYTPAARAAEGGANAINSLISLGVTQTNRALDNSGLSSPRLRLVGTAEVSYSETTNMELDLQRLQGTSDGFMDNVHALRNSLGADLVKLVVATYTTYSPLYCGIAYIPRGLDPGFHPWSFSVTARDCVSTTVTFPHELGHNMGCNHAPDDPYTPGWGAFPYSFGYKDPGRFRTVMAYACSGSSCPEVLHFSSPIRFYQGRVTGTANQDNARSIANARFTIANWRQSSPGTPTNLTASVSGSTVTFSWSAPTSGGTPTTYVLELGSSPGASNILNIETGSTATTYTLTNVGPGTYYARVRARNSAGTSSPSNEITVVVSGILPPGAPSNLSASVSGSTVTLTWSAPTTGGAPTTYVIEVGSSPGASNLLNRQTGSTATAFTLSGVGSGTHYARVRARNSGGTSLPSNEVTFAGGGLAPGPPSNLIGWVSGSTVTFTWIAPATGGTPTTYVLQAGSSPGASNLLNITTGSTATSYTVINFPSGTSYVRVRARNGAGTSAPSNEVTVVVGCVPSAPTGLVAAISGSTVTLSWNAASGATSYVIEAGSAPGASNLAIIDTGGTATTFTAANVPPGAYFVRVRARNSCGLGGPSNELLVWVL